MVTGSGGDQASAPAVTEEHDAFARRHRRHNVTALGVDYGLFLVGLSFASQSTILPAFAEHLGASNVVIGAIPAVMTLGWFLPSLFAAPYTGTLPRKLPFVLRWTVWERAPFAGLALVAFLLAGRAPRVSLALVLACLLVVTGVGGLLMPAWMDIVGRTIPTGMRGRFFALANLGGSLGAFLGSLLTAWVLGAMRPPASYGVCFTAATLFVGLSYFALALVREPEAPVTTAPPTLGHHLAAVRDLLRQDANFAAFLVARGFAVAGGMAAGFYTVDALRTRGAAEWQVGIFTTMLLLGQLAGNLVLGWLADRAGHRVVIMAGVVASVGANAVALTTASVEALTPAFALLGVQGAAVGVSNLTVLLEFAPTVAARPTYVGLGTTAVAPAAFGAPLVAGLLADRLGFAAVFGVAALAGLAAFAVLAFRVHDPRGARAGAGGMPAPP